MPFCIPQDFLPKKLLKILPLLLLPAVVTGCSAENQGAATGEGSSDQDRLIGYWLKQIGGIYRTDTLPPEEENKAVAIAFSSFKTAWSMRQPSFTEPDFAATYQCDYETGRAMLDLGPSATSHRVTGSPAPIMETSFARSGQRFSKTFTIKGGRYSTFVGETMVIGNSGQVSFPIEGGADDYICFDSIKSPYAYVGISGADDHESEFDFFFCGMGIDLKTLEYVQIVSDEDAPIPSPQDTKRVRAADPAASIYAPVTMGVGMCRKVDGAAE